MAKIRCAISGITFSCDHVPMFLGTLETKHPIFYLPRSKLFGLYSRYTGGGSTATDNWLLYNALLHSSELVTYKTAAAYSENDSSRIIANNLPRLVETISRIDAVNHRLHSSVFAHCIVSAESSTLQDSGTWIDVWNANYIEFLSGAKRELIARDVRNRESILRDRIKGHRGIESYSKILANWAADAASFPLTEVWNELTGTRTTLREYWKQILILCNKEERIYAIPKADLDELIEHCEQNITESSIYSTTLYTLLKNGRLKQKNYLGLGDLDISGSPYRIVSAGQTIEDAQKLALIDSAPKTEPIEKNYPSKLAYLRAKMNWKLAQDYAGNKQPNSILESL